MWLWLIKLGSLIGCLFKGILFLLKILLANSIYIYLIFGVTFVFFSQNLKPQKKANLLMVKVVLFFVFLLIKHGKSLSPEGRFTEIHNNYIDVDFLSKNPNFKFELKDQRNHSILFQQDLLEE